jgi:type IV pilus assembly protein PilM
MSLDLEQAEIAKQEVGLNGSHREIAKHLNEAVRPLLADIRSSIHYFGSTNEGTVLERISLTGGASGLRGLAELLAEQLGVPTNVVTPMQHIRNRWANKQAQTEDNEGFASAVSVGLAMGAAA